MGAGGEAGGAPRPRAVVLVSMDGFAASYLDAQPAAQLPALNALAARGVRGSMVNAFQTKTFPNHWTLATGLWEESHGIVGNEMWDPALGDNFTLATKDARWWGGEPVWQTAERQGVRAATFFWPGSDVPGKEASRFRDYDDRVPYEDRVDQVLEWLAAPDPPGVVTLYFEEPDHAGHLHGPFAAETAAAARRVDAAVGRLVGGIERLGLAGKVDLIVTSDHGMAETAPERTVYLGSCSDRAQYNVSGLSPVAGVWASPGAEATILRELQACHPNLTVWAKEDVPERFHWKHSPRVAPVVAAADEGWSICLGDPGEACFNCCGNHGYDNELLSMHPVFLAAGPSFREGLLAPPFQNVDVYPLMCHLQGLEPSPNNGSLSRVCSLLAAGCDPAGSPQGLDRWGLFLAGLVAGAALCGLAAGLTALWGKAFSDGWGAGGEGRGGGGGGGEGEGGGEGGESKEGGEGESQALLPVEGGPGAGSEAAGARPSSSVARV